MIPRHVHVWSYQLQHGKVVHISSRHPQVFRAEEASLRCAIHPTSKGILQTFEYRVESTSGSCLHKTLLLSWTLILETESISLTYFRSDFWWLNEEGLRQRLFTTVLRPNARTHNRHDFTKHSNFRDAFFNISIDRQTIHYQCLHTCGSSSSPDAPALTAKLHSSPTLLQVAKFSLNAKFGYGGEESWYYNSGAPCGSGWAIETFIRHGYNS